MIGPRLKKAREIAERRARELEGSESYSEEDVRRYGKFNTKERLHREPAHRGLGQLRKHNGTCDCKMCKIRKAKQYKGESKRQRDFLLDMEEADYDVPE